MTTALDDKLEACPTGPGVYLMKDAGGHVIYVGKAKNLRMRVRSYFQKQADHSVKTRHLVGHIRDIEFLRAGTEVEALLLENNLIKKWKPKYNISLKDDKSYPYVRIDFKHEFPRAYVARKQLHGDGSEYFGPFPNAGALRETLKLAGKVFLLRDCRDHEFANRSRPCLSYQIKQCSAPCVGYASQAEYGRQVADFKAFIGGDSQGLEAQWEREMEQAAEAMNFELAAKLRDRLKAIRAVIYQDQRIIDTQDATDRDVWALWPEPAVIEKRGDDEPRPEFSAPAEYDSFDEAALALDSEVPVDDASDEERLLEVGDPFQDDCLDILILQFRGGKWVGRVHRTADIAERVGTEDFLATLLLQHYAKHTLPQQILLPDGEFPERGAFAEALLSVSKATEMGKAPGEQVERAAPEIRFTSEKGEWTKLGELALENVKGMHEDERALRERRDDGLIAIARMLDLPHPPERLECVDISNMQGEANVASCVVFKHGRPDKGEYRHYNIQGFIGQNDFASMREVMSRRYGKPDSPRPDLLVVDGGKGQLASAVEILKGLGCDFPVVGLAKARTKRDFRSEDVASSEERIFVPGRMNPIIIKHAEAFRILTQLRDEAHRFAITFHRQKRSKARGLS